MVHLATKCLGGDNSFSEICDVLKLVLMEKTSSAEYGFFQASRAARAADLKFPWGPAESKPALCLRLEISLGSTNSSMKHNESTESLMPVVVGVGSFLDTFAAPSVAAVDELPAKYKFVDLDFEFCRQAKEWR